MLGMERGAGERGHTPSKELAWWLAGAGGWSLQRRSREGAQDCVAFFPPGALVRLYGLEVALGLVLFYLPCSCASLAPVPASSLAKPRRKRKGCGGDCWRGKGSAEKQQGFCLAASALKESPFPAPSPSAPRPLCVYVCVCLFTAPDQKKTRLLGWPR